MSMPVGDCAPTRSTSTTKNGRLATVSKSLYTAINFNGAKGGEITTDYDEEQGDLKNELKAKGKEMERRDYPWIVSSGGTRVPNQATSA